MSKSASPSITQYFKAQRKRPRGSLNKEDVVMSATKKLLLEEGIHTSTGGGSGGGTVQFEDTKCKPTKVVTETKSVGKQLKSKPVKAAAKAKSRKKNAESNPKKVVADTKSEAVEESKNNTPAELVAESKSKEDDPKYKPSEAPEPAPPPISEGSKSSAPPEEVSIGPLEIEPSSKNVTASPVKFLKVASLSPAKKKKMTAEQVAKLLKRKTKLKELKSALEGINQCSQKLSDFRRTVAESSPTMSPAKAQPVEVAKSPAITSVTKGVPSSQFYSPTPADRLKSDIERLSASKVTSPSKLVQMNNKIKKKLFDEQKNPAEAKEKTMPAYQRFHNLAQKTPAEKGPVEAGEEIDLPLPFHFKMLKELFIAVETVVGIMKGRKENIIFPKVKSGVLDLFKRTTLLEKHLAQMATILPNCYGFDLEKIDGQYHLKLTVEDMLPSVVCTRRREFHANLIKICLEQHEKFLLGLVPPIVVPKDKQITRWHPQFRLDEIPEIVPTENLLPVKPIPDKITSAREMIAKAQSILGSANPRMQQAVKNMLNNAEVQSPSTSSTASTKAKNPATAKALKGLSSSLLEKIRNREREKLLNEMTRTPAESKKLQMAKRLPNFIKVIRNMMVAEKKIAIPMSTMIDRVSHSIQNMSDGDTEGHLRLLATLLPSWARIHKLSHSDVEYFRIEKNTDINDLILEMNDIIKRLSS